MSNCYLLFPDFVIFLSGQNGKLGHLFVDLALSSNDYFAILKQILM